MSPAARGARDADGRPARRNREREVMEAAIDVFWEKGYADASVQDVADRVGVLKGSLYHYISSKEDLLFHVLDDSHQQGLEIIKRMEAREGPPLERLRAFMEEYLTWYLQNLKRVSVYFSESRFLTDERLDMVRRQQRSYDKVVMGLIVEAQERGEVDASIDPKLTTLFVNAAVNGVSKWYRPGGTYSPTAVARAYADLALRTLQPART